MKEYALHFPNELTTEKILLTPLGENLYRLEESSLSETGTFYHDIIEAKFRFGFRSGKGLCFLRVVERSGLRVFRFLLSTEVTDSQPFAEFLQRMKAHSGYWEQIFNGIILVHLPRGTSCRPKSEIRAIRSMVNTASA